MKRNWAELPNMNDTLIYAVVLVIIVILILYFKDQILVSVGKKPAEVQPTEMEMAKSATAPTTEGMEVDPTPKTAQGIVKEEGYGGDLNWTEVIKTTDLDPSTFDNHRDFIKETRRYSSGANFTSTTDDNISPQMVNFVGLRRPSSVPIHAGRRQVEDLQYDVFDRNKEKEIRWGQGVYIRNDDGQYAEDD